MTTIRTRTRFGAVLAIAILALTGCASASQPASTPAPVEGAGADTVHMADAWVKAAESGMTAGFGQLNNDSTRDVTVVAATTPASSALELHETVADDAGQMKMQEVAGGFTIPAGGTLLLEPGGNHLMLMDLTAPLDAGTTVTFVLEFADGSTYEFDAAVKDFAGANENYHDDHGHDDHGHDDHGHDDHDHDHDHDDHDHEDDH